MNVEECWEMIRINIIYSSMDTKYFQSKHKEYKRNNQAPLDDCESVEKCEKEMKAI